ncbi:MAG: hypothetical protein KDE19_12800 [Caldilineaceae bacterium]|nr:hypothetical protein [Caldilineaceae bacterium]
MHVNCSTGERFELEKSFNRGGEAEIWSVRREPHLVAKLYHHPTAEHEAKLATMIANPPHQANTHPAVAWPLHLLYQKRRFVGYLMPRVSDSRPIFHFYNPARRSRLAAGYPWRYFLHRTAQNLAAAVELIHDRGHVIGDLNESNVLVNREALVTLVDCDSFQVQGTAATNGVINALLGRPAPLCTYRSMVGKAEFTAPELQGVDFKSIDRTPAHDNFALSVMLFYLLMEGYHPFAGIVKADQTAGQLSNRQSIGRVDLYGIRQGFFPHARNCPVQPPPRAPKLMWLAPDLQAAFLRSFVEGHQDADRRPTAKEWRVLLAQAESTLVACPSAEKHVYSSHLWRCPHCERNTVPPLAVEPVPSQASTNGKENAARTAAWPKVPKLASTFPTTWQPYWGYAKRGVAWSTVQGAQLRQRTHQQYAVLLAWLLTLPEQVQQTRTTVHQYAGVWQRWTIGQLVGVPAGSALALGVYAVAGQTDMTPVLPLALLPLPLSLEWLFALMAAGFTAMLGVSQAWALRTVVLRWSYLRELWVGIAALTGALLGLLIAGQGGGLLPTVTPTTLLEQGSTLPLWSAAHLQVSGLTLFFGATLGFLQSFLLRQQLSRADDGRVWTVANGVAWLLVMEVTLLGVKLGAMWDVATWRVADWLPFTALGSQAGSWFGLLLGGTLGLLGASLLTGSVLLWLLQGPRRSTFWPQVALQFLRTGNIFFPFQRLRVTGRRWGRALLLLVVIVLLIEGVVAVGWG